MSLRDQLLKSGLVSKEKAKQVDHAQKKQNYQAQKDKRVKETLDQEKKQRAIELNAFDQAKKLLDMEKNKQIELNKQIKNNRIIARAIIDEKRVNDPKAEERFNFSPNGKKIHFVLVTAKQREQLKSGELAICRNDRDGFDYPLIPLKEAMKLKEFEAIDSHSNWVLLLNDSSEVPNDLLDEWAAWDAYEKDLKNH